MAKLSLTKMLATDEDAEENGKWFLDVLGDESGLDLKIRRMTSRAVAKAQQRMMTENRHLQTKGRLPEDVDKRLLHELLGGVVLVDWRGVVDDNGDEVPYSAAAATEYVAKLPEFARIIQFRANSMDAFRRETVEEIEKN